MRSSWERPWRSLAASAAAYVAITVILGREVLQHLGTAVANDAGDPLLTAAILYWNATVLPLTEAWWNFPIFHPTRDVLAFSEHLLGLSPIATPLYWLTGDALVTYNLVTLLTFPLCGLAMFALVYRLTRSGVGAFIAGLAFAFAPYRIAQLPHVQMLACFWAPLALLGLHAYVDSGRRRWLVLYAVTWLLQGLANGYSLVFFSILVGLWVLWFVIAQANWRALGAIAAATVVAFLPLLPILLRYVNVHALHGLARHAGEIRFFSADVAAVMCAPEPLTLWGWLRTACRPEGELFPGLAVIVLAAVAIYRVVTHLTADAHASPSRSISMASRGLLTVGVFYAVVICTVLIGGPWRLDMGLVRVSASSLEKPVLIGGGALFLGLVLAPGLRVAVRQSSNTVFYLIAALVTWILALGPSVTYMGNSTGYEGPFTWLLHLPGVDGLRVPARFWLMTVLCLSAVAGLVVADLLKGRRRVVVASGILVVSLAVLSDTWVRGIPIEPAPAAVPAPGALRGAAVLQLPMGEPLADIAAQYRAVIGGWRSVNGYSGYLPRYYQPLMQALRFEDDKALTPFTALEDLHVVVAEDAPRLMELVERQPGAVLTARRGGMAQYRVPRHPGGFAPIELGERVPIASLHASCWQANAAFALDGDRLTSWQCGAIRSGQELTIDLGRETPVGAVVHSPDEGRSPRHLIIETSLDGASWREAWSGDVTAPLIAQAIAKPGPMLRVAASFEPRAARYVRLRHLGWSDETAWAVIEVEIWRGR